MARAPEALPDAAAAAARDSAQPDTSGWTGAWSEEDAPADTARRGPEAAPAAAQAAPSDSLLQLSVEAVEYTWVRVTWDGNGRFEGVLAPGARRTWQTRDQFQVVAGKAHGLRYWFQGQLLEGGRLGDPNQVLRFRASRSGVDVQRAELRPQSSAAPSGAPP
jgi:hypothetical protein